MTKILAVNGSYRINGITDQVIATLTEELKQAGVEVETVFLRDYPIEFCLNCRECTQALGEQPGICVQEDGMQALINKIEKADGYIFAAPTNLGSVTAIFKRFMERLTVYAYWPRDKIAPQPRKKAVIKKKALLVSSCAAPGIIGRWFYETQNQLKLTAKIIGAEVVDSVFVGLIANENKPQLSVRIAKQLRKVAGKLVC